MVEIMADRDLVDAVEAGGVYYLDGGGQIPVSLATRVYTIKEAADRLKASYAQVASWLRSGKLAGMQVGGYFWRVPEWALTQFVRPRRGRPSLHRDETGEWSGGQVIVAFLALLFILAVAALFRNWHVDIWWLFQQFVGGW